MLYSDDVVIEFLIIFIIIFFLGYWCGKSLDIITDTQDAFRYADKQMNRLVIKQTPTGQIKPKTAKEIQDRSLPDKIREGRQAMKEELDSHPELAARRRLIEQYKKEGRKL